MCVAHKNQIKPLIEGGKKERKLKEKLDGQSVNRDSWTFVNCEGVKLYVNYIIHQCSFENNT